MFCYLLKRAFFTWQLSNAKIANRTGTQARTHSWADAYDAGASSASWASVVGVVAAPSAAVDSTDACTQTSQTDVAPEATSLENAETQTDPPPDASGRAMQTEPMYVSLTLRLGEGVDAEISGRVSQDHAGSLPYLHLTAPPPPHANLPRDRHRLRET